MCQTAVNVDSGVRIPFFRLQVTHLKSLHVFVHRAARAYCRERRQIQQNAPGFVNPQVMTIVISLINDRVTSHKAPPPPRPVSWVKAARNHTGEEMKEETVP